MLVERAGRRLAHGGIGIAQPAHEQRGGAGLHDVGQLQHRHAAHAGIRVRAARGDIVEIGIAGVEHGVVTAADREY